MKNIRGIVSLCLVALMLMAVLSACGNESKLIGTWESTDSDETLVLANDGTGSITVGGGLSGALNWSVNNNKIFLTFSMCGMTQTEEFTYEVDSHNLKLIDLDGTVEIYTKRVTSQ